MGDNKNINTYSEIDYLSLLQIKYDCETIKSLTLSIKNNGIIAFSLIPYISLAANAVLEIIDVKLEDEDTYFKRIEDVRLKLKFFEDGYSRSKRMLLNIDHLQNEDFKNKLKSPLLKNENRYYNLGIFTDKNKVVVGNTHYYCYLLQDNRLLKKNLSEVSAAYSTSPDEFNLNEQAKLECYKYGYACGGIIAIACKSLASFDVPITIKSRDYSFDTYYSDINTNNAEIFTSKECDKGDVLFILHILSTLNTPLYILNGFEQDDYGWWLKINYIAYYYCIRKLKSLLEHYTQNAPIPCELSNLFEDLNLKNAPYISGTFRNYIMHSSFVDNNGNFIISSSHINKSTPLFGLVETCFDGKSYNEIKLSVISEMKRISDLLAQWLNIKSLNRKPL